MITPTDTATKRIVMSRSGADSGAVAGDQGAGVVTGGNGAWNPTSLTRVRLSHAFGTAYNGSASGYVPDVANRTGYPVKILGYYPGQSWFTNPTGLAALGDATNGCRGRLALFNGTTRVLSNCHFFEARTATGKHPVRGSNSTVTDIQTEIAIMEDAATNGWYNNGFDPPSTTRRFDSYFDGIGNALNQLTDNELQRIMLRPNHEVTGGWYRWGTIVPQNLVNNAQAATLEAQLQAAYRAMWIRMHDRISARLGARATMLSWVFNLAGPLAQTRTNNAMVNAYPGDAYVDVISYDDYCANDSSDGELQNNLDALDAFLVTHPKVTAIDECGIHQKFTVATDWGPTAHVPWATTLRDWARGHMTNPNTGLAHVIDYEIDADGNAIRILRDRSDMIVGRASSLLPDTTPPPPNWVNRTDANNKWVVTTNGVTYATNHPEIALFYGPHMVGGNLVQGAYWP